MAWWRILPETLQAPAVDVQRDAGDEAGTLGAEKRDGVGELLRPAPPAERILARGDAPRFIFARDTELGDEAGDVARPHSGVDPAGTDGVDEHVVGAELRRQRLGDVQQRAVRDPAAEHVRIRLLAGAADDVDDAPPAPGAHVVDDGADRAHEAEQLRL